MTVVTILSRANQLRCNAVSPGARLAVTAAAAAALYFRQPDYFARPQFWAEDGLAWLQTYSYGWHSLAMPMAGYQLFAMHLIAMLAAAFPI
jgi:hypothetical protein